MKMIRERASADRQEALTLAYLALRPLPTIEGHEQNISAAKIRLVIQTLRPHYNAYKIDALMQILDQNDHALLGLSDFRTRIQKVLHTSLRSARQISRQSIFLKSLTLFVAIANLAYVLLYSSPLEFLLLSNLIFPFGSIIAFLSLVEVTLRLRPCACLSTLSASRHSVLDGLAIFAGVASLVGVIMHIVDNSKGLQTLLFGRAVGKILYSCTLSKDSSHILIKHSS
jgi:hypothetical protein